jgi:hypothetical protein
MIDTNMFLKTVLSSTPMKFDFVILVILVIIGLLMFYFFTIKYNEYKNKKYMHMIENLLSEEKLKTMYSNIRAKHNHNQLEFPFVKEIDDAYVAARYNLNAEEEE